MTQAARSLWRSRPLPGLPCPLPLPPAPTTGPTPAPGGEGAVHRFKLKLPVGPSQFPGVCGCLHSGQALGSEPQAPRAFLP